MFVEQIRTSEKDRQREEETSFEPICQSEVDGKFPCKLIFLLKIISGFTYNLFYESEESATSQQKKIGEMRMLLREYFLERMPASFQRTVV